jgi:pimeloyl-ACP methyl ester carboxylesterase
MWMYQVSALISAGYRVITVENRGVPPSDVCPEGFTLADMVADVSGLIRYLAVEPCRIIGYSLGGMIVQELLLAYPDQISQAVLMASRGRSDSLRTALSEAESDLLDSGIALPPRYVAVVRALQYMSPRTLNDEQRIRDWLDIFDVSPADSQIVRAQRGLEMIGNRLEEYRKIVSPCLVVAFADDLIAPPYLCRELVESIPGCEYAEIAGCGHYGYAEDPVALNSVIIDFFRG